MGAKRKLGSLADSRPYTKRRKQSNNRHPQLHIPHCLRKSIIVKDSRDSTIREYEIQFPLESIDVIQRLAWGIDDTVAAIIVRIEFRRNAGAFTGFCVHNSNEKTPRSDHQYCLREDEDPNKTVCSSRPNILTCLISTKLHQAIKSGKASLAAIYQKVDGIINRDPTATCLICKKSIDVKIWSAIGCSERCRKILKLWPLQARLSYLITDTKSFDLLLCCINTAALGIIRCHPRVYCDNLLEGCPVQLDRIASVINSLPKDLSLLGSTSIPRGYLKSRYDKERVQLLSWLCSNFRGCMISLPPSADFYVPGLKRANQFLLLNSHVEREKVSRDKLSILPSKCGSVAFHGTPSFRAFNILLKGLQVSGGKLFYAPEPSISLNYSRGLRADRRGVFFRQERDGHFNFSPEPSTDEYLKPWKKSAFLGSEYLMLFGCEVSHHSIAWKMRNGTLFESWTPDENTVSVRYIFLCPASAPIVSATTMQETMLKTYKALSKGQVTPGDVTGASELCIPPQTWI